MQRRELVAAVAVVGSSTLSGCLEYLGFEFGGTGYVDFEVENRDSQQHDVQITVEGDGFDDERTKTVPEAGRVLFEEVVPRLDYRHEFTVTMALSGSEVFNEQYRMHEEKRTWAFSITPDGDIEAQFATDEDGLPL